MRSPVLGSKGLQLGFTDPLGALLRTFPRPKKPSRSPALGFFSIEYGLNQTTRNGAELGFGKPSAAHSSPDSPVRDPPAF